MNDTETSGSICAEAVPTKIENARRDLIALRVKHGATSAIGARCSNIIELLQVPEVPRELLNRQMADLARLTRAFQ